MMPDPAIFLELLRHCERIAALAATDRTHHAQRRAGIRERVNIKSVIRDESLAAAALIRAQLEQPA